VLTPRRPYGLVYPISASNGNGGGVVRVGVNYKF